MNDEEDKEFSIAENLCHIHNRIKAACKRSGFAVTAALRKLRSVACSILTADEGEDENTIICVWASDVKGKTSAWHH